MHVMKRRRRSRPSASGPGGIPAGAAASRGFRGCWDTPGVTRESPPAAEGSEFGGSVCRVLFAAGFGVGGRLGIGAGSPAGGRRRRVGNLHGKASKGDWIGGVGRAGPKGREGKVGAEPGAEREALGRRWRRTNPPRAAEGHFRGQRGRPCSHPAPTRDRDQASSGKAAADLRAAGGGLRLSPALPLCPEPGDGAGPGLAPLALSEASERD